MVCFLSLQLTNKNSILHYKVIKVTIDALNFTEVILDIVVCCQNLPNWLLPIETFSNIVICYRSLLVSVVTNRDFFFFFKTYCYCAIFQTSNAAILLHSICKPAALSKSQIAPREPYPRVFAILNQDNWQNSFR